MAVGLTQEAQRAAYRQLLNDCGRFVRVRSVLKKRIDSALRIQCWASCVSPSYDWSVFALCYLATEDTE
jgi:hypothetical protein